LLGRGVSWEVIEHFEVGVALKPQRDHFFAAGCLVFPLKDGARSGYILRDRNGAYRNSKGLDRESSLYNGDALDLARSERLYIVEGIFDVLVMGGKAVATLGTSISDKQLQRFLEYPGEVVFACDGEARRVSRMAAKRLQLRGKKDSYWVDVHAGRDPGNLGYGAVSALPLCS
jgi:DNA primase